jgi:hypothetical protein
LFFANVTMPADCIILRKIEINAALSPQCDEAQASESDLRAKQDVGPDQRGSYLERSQCPMLLTRAIRRSIG